MVLFNLHKNCVVVAGPGPALPLDWRQPVTIFWERQEACRSRICLVVGLEKA